VFNEIEEAIVAALADGEKGLPSDGEQGWYVPTANIGRQPPNLQAYLEAVLPAVCFAVSEFSVAEEGFAGIGELEEAEEGLTEICKLKFDLLYRLDAWATELDNANAIAQKAVEILMLARDGLMIEGDDYRLLKMRPVAGRDVPVELEGATVFRRQLDYRIESELLIEILQPAIKEVVIEKVEWEVSEE